MTIDNVFERAVLLHPPVEMVSSIRLPAALLHGGMREIHPLRNSRCTRSHWNGFLVGTIYSKVEFGEVDEATWPNCQRNVIDKSLIVTDLD